MLCKHHHWWKIRVVAVASVLQALEEGAAVLAAAVLEGHQEGGHWPDCPGAAFLSVFLLSLSMPK